MPRPWRRRAREFGRSVVYNIAGLPIAVRPVVARAPNSAVSTVRRAYARRYWRPKTAADALSLALALILGPIAVIGLEIAFIRKNGAAVARRTGRSASRQFADQLRLYCAAGVLAPWYYIFEMASRPSSKRARSYFYRWESKGGVYPLLREGHRAPTSELTNKAVFAEQCRARNVPTVPVLALAERGCVQLLAQPHALMSDLFVKPTYGCGGKGAERWDWTGRGFTGSAGEQLNVDDFVSRLAERSRATSLIVQPLVRNGRLLRTLNNGALSTVRVLTCLDQRGEPEVIGAAMRMAIGRNRTVDNLHAGGIAAGVDVATGRIGRASTLGADHFGWVDRHPDTGARISGLRYPRWSEVKLLAVSAHRAFADRVLIGWDIALTTESLLVVEGNGSPDLDILQRFGGQGLLTSRLGELLAFHLSREIAAPLAA